MPPANTSANAAKSTGPLADLRATMAALRNPQTGCPWDIEQTPTSLCSKFIEECLEAVDAIENADVPNTCEELGDVLCHIVMQTQMAEEAGTFTFEDVARGINQKLIRRHPHVFGEANAESVDAVYKIWDAAKAAEKAQQAQNNENNENNESSENGKGNAPSPSPFKNLPAKLPALMYAAAIHKQGLKFGLEQKRETSTELTEATAGAQLYALAAKCQAVGICPETALRRYTKAHTAHMEHMENKERKTET